MKKVILVCFSLMVSGCSSDDAVKAIQANLKACLSNAETENDKILCLEETKSYRESCFDKNGGSAYSSACVKLINKYN